MAFAILFKVARDDFTYWVPIDSATTTFLVACIVRVSMKVILDFTGLLQARHPYEYGGGYFSLTILTSPIICLYFGSRYLAYVDNEEVRASMETVFSSEQVYGAIGGMAVLQIITLTSILLLIPQRLRFTFTTWQTGSKFITDRFLVTEADKEKISIFSDHRNLWLPILEEVRKWLNDGLVDWMEEDPEWFDDFTRSSVPDDLVNDKAVLKKLRGAKVEEGSEGEGGEGEGAKGEETIRK